MGVRVLQPPTRQPRNDHCVEAMQSPRPHTHTPHTHPHLPHHKSAAAPAGTLLLSQTSNFKLESSSSCTNARISSTDASAATTRWLSAFRSAAGPTAPPADGRRAQRPLMSDTWVANECTSSPKAEWVDAARAVMSSLGAAIGKGSRA